MLLLAGKRYEHAIPGMQGNNIWMTRQLAHLRELQGDTTRATSLRQEASAMAAETVRTMYSTSQDLERGWFNVIHPVGPNGTKPLQVRCNPYLPPSTSESASFPTQ